MSVKKIQGIIPPIVTPMCNDNEIDVLGAQKLLNRMIEAGVHGIFALGTTGEAQSLSYKCRYDFTKLVCEQVNGRVPVLIGITDTSIVESIKLAEWAKQHNASAVVAAPPYYFTSTQHELIEYYTELADRSPLPVYLYNMPSHVKVTFEAITVRTLAQHPNIVGIKDSSANMAYFQSLMHILREQPEFALFVGPEELLGETVLLGADGGVNGGANMFPELYVKMYYAAMKQDVELVRELQGDIMSISTSIYTVGQNGSSYLKGVKCALSLMGICNDYMPLPYSKFMPEQREKIKAALHKLGVTTIDE